MLGAGLVRTSVISVASSAGTKCSLLFLQAPVNPVPFSNRCKAPEVLGGYAPATTLELTLRFRRAHPDTGAPTSGPARPRKRPIKAGLETGAPLRVLPLVAVSS